ncbi:MAG: methylated-DNA--[protein]-cysteine S-methyltransferase [Syntrophaceae bacterium]
MTGDALFHELVKTRFGEAAVVWSADRQGPRIAWIFLPAPTGKTLRDIRRMFPGAATKSCETVTKLGATLRTCLEGKAVSFDTSVLNMSRVAPYHRKVLRALAEIPRGRVRTYGEVASRTGASGGARAAGQGCAKNPFPIVFPCHRVIRSDRSLGGFGGGLPLKRALLEMEGVKFDAKGKVLPEYILP